MLIAIFLALLSSIRAEPMTMKELKMDDTHPCKAENLKVNILQNYSFLFV